MIPLKLQLILIITCLLGMIFLVNRIKQYKLELKYALLWIVLSFISIIISLFPKLLILISSVLEIEKPVNALFLFGFIAAFLILYSLTVSLSRSSGKIKELSQELGILKNELEKNINNRNSRENDNEN